MKRLGAWAGAVGVTWAAYHHLTPLVTPKVDGALLGTIGLSFGLCVAAMLGGTRLWSARGLGLLSTMLATSLLYLRAAAGGFGHPILEGRLAVDFIRALYLVGGVLLLYGMTQWLLENWRAFFRWRHRKGHRAEELFDL